MRVYSHLEQELIAKQVLGSLAEKKSASSANKRGANEAPTKARSASNTESLLRANDSGPSARPTEPRAEGTRAIQLMVDLECESKFGELLRWLAGRMPHL